MNKKYSIVIPTYNHLEDCLKPCIESIIKFTDLSTVEIIVVANGCVDGTKDYLATLPPEHFKTIWIDQPAGYTHSTNQGIKAASGEFIILLNNDTVLLPQPVNSWIDMLVTPFQDPSVGATGPMKNWCPHSKRNFLIFFCVMIRKTMFDKFGLLDEIFNPGFGEDTDFSIKIKEGGFKCIQVPYQDPLIADMKQERMTGGFPIFHFGEKTLGDMAGGNELLNKNRKILEDRWGSVPPTYDENPQLHVMNQSAEVKEEPKDPYAHLMKLNLGCGSTILPDYLNADLYNPAAQVKADATKLPFPDGRFEEIFACHIFEHLNPYHVGDILQEWKRALKPGGKLVMEMPDILEICRNFEKSTKDERYRLLNCVYGTTQIEHPHLFGWYPEILNDHLIYAGYENIVFMPAKVYHWGFNMRVECHKSKEGPIVKKDTPAIDKLVDDVFVIKLEDTPEVLTSELPPITKQELPEGFFSTGDIEIYRNLISSLENNSVIAELGCWKGRSLCSIADLVKEKNLTVIAVDTFGGTDNCLEDFLAKEAGVTNIRQIFEDNLKRFGIFNNVKIMQMTTLEAASLIDKETLDFVFVDADHRYECVKNDVYAWMPAIKKGKIIAGHDAKWHTVFTAVSEIFKMENVYCVDNVWWTPTLNKGKVYDCFTFFNELDILEIRLNELNSVVDKFVIVEATKTHTDLDKPLYFLENKERYSKFLHKIIHVVVDNMPPGDTWTRERFQRDCIDAALKDCTDKDILIISDADEIPRMEVVRDYRIQHGPKKFHQDLFYYSLNNKCHNDTPWDWCKILPYSVYKGNKMTPCAVRYTDCPALPNGGWHFSFIGNVEFIKKKISSWAHAEFNIPEINNDLNIETSIKAGKDVFGRTLLFQIVEVDGSYPKFIRDNINEFKKKELIREKC